MGSRCPTSKSRNDGEATKRLSNATRERAPEIEWSQVAGFRDVAIHGYATVSLERTWAIVERELPRLKSAVRRLLKSIE
ncbi:MAG: DUF86 domain-containing protein [Nitrososphaerota archaeon]|nr:DUF86 domain-containing protein [Nitrososphaerota archaeon]